MQYTVLINVVATKMGGAVTILNTFVDYIKRNVQKENITFYLFSTLDTFTDYGNIHVIKVEVPNYKARIKWDNGGLREFCQKRGIKPSLIFSKQNTCTNWPGIPQLVYYDQPLPLFYYPWNPLKKEDRLGFLYSHFYAYYVKKYSQDAQYIVQLEEIKKRFCNVYKNIDSDRVHVITPDKPKIKVSSISVDDNIKSILNLRSGKSTFIYPAYSQPYKNHIVIIKALSCMTKEERNKIQVLFTLEPDGKIAKLIKKNGITDCCRCIGSIQYKDLLGIYKEASGGLFASKIESYGLPMIEFTAFGLPIVASDFAYTREVLKNYKNVLFVDADSPENWKTAILKSIEKSRTPVELDENESSWKNCFDIIFKMMKYIE